MSAPDNKWMDRYGGMGEVDKWEAILRDATAKVTLSRRQLNTLQVIERYCIDHINALKEDQELELDDSRCTYQHLQNELD